MLCVIRVPPFKQIPQLMQATTAVSRQQQQQQQQLEEEEQLEQSKKVGVDWSVCRLGW